MGGTDRETQGATEMVAILGAGVMGETLLSGLLRAGRSSEDVVITERRPDRAAELSRRVGADMRSLFRALYGLTMTYSVRGNIRIGRETAEYGERFIVPGGGIEIAGGSQRILATVTQLRMRGGGERNYHRRGNEKSGLHDAPCC